MWRKKMNWQRDGGTHRLNILYTREGWMREADSAAPLQKVQQKKKRITWNKSFYFVTQHVSHVCLSWRTDVPSVLFPGKGRNTWFVLIHLWISTKKLHTQQMWANQTRVPTSNERHVLLLSENRQRYFLVSDQIVENISWWIHVSVLQAAISLAL